MKAITARVILIRTQRLMKMKKKLNKMKKKSQISNLLKRKQTILQTAVGQAVVIVWMVSSTFFRIINYFASFWIIFKSSIWNVYPNSYFLIVVGSAAVSHITPGSWHTHRCMGCWGVLARCWTQPCIKSWRNLTE